ncbi:LysR family transcriptional regulator [Allokutzneria sp. A3M-2-11 16]|uniref:LysR family transcriptional regulator n=1 Tax=Allokutzneria sp. A3M-2-11 16 TaxID=2962043 RepID=UPI0020B8A093|nr:LysR family transcriptional regulator [Allokutzneria sp. A3M-2-11 16]MCP3798613.1 LysR family transcriptional regulator [Allokutzneria sp. A3M-2-11 16]
MDDRVERLVTELAPRLRLLRALAEEQHITRVAERLGVPQPTVSRWLAELGRSLGAPVVVRSGRGVQLTRAGRMLVDAATQSLGALEPGCRRAAEEADPKGGHVAFGFLRTMSPWVPALLREFKLRRPTVRFTLMQGAHPTVLEKLREGAIDLALTSPMPVDEPDLETRPWVEQELVLAVPADHRLAARRRVRLREVSDDAFVTTRPGYGLRQITDKVCAAAGFTPRLAFEGDDVDTVRGLVSASLGVAVLPRADPPARGVVELAITPRPTRTVGLAWVAGRPIPAAGRAFRDFAVSHAHP